MSRARPLLTFDQAKAMMEQAHAIPIMHLVDQFLVPGKAAANEPARADHKDQKDDSPTHPRLCRNEAFSRLRIRLARGIISVDQQAFETYIQQLEQIDARSYKFYSGLSVLEHVVLGLTHTFVYAHKEAAIASFRRALYTSEAGSHLYDGYAHGLLWMLTSEPNDFTEISKNVSSFTPPLEPIGLNYFLYGAARSSSSIYYCRKAMKLKYTCGKYIYDITKAAEDSELLVTDIAQGDSVSLQDYAFHFIAPTHPEGAQEWFQLATKYGSFCGAMNVANHLTTKQQDRAAQYDDGHIAFYYRSALRLSGGDQVIGENERLHIHGLLTTLRKKEVVDFDVIYHYAMAFNNSDDLNYVVKHAPEIFVRLWSEDYNNPLQNKLKQQAIACLLTLKPETLPNESNRALTDLLANCPEKELQAQAAKFRTAAIGTVIAPAIAASASEAPATQLLDFNEAKAMLERAHAIPIMHLVEQFLNPGKKCTQQPDAKQLAEPDLRDHKSEAPLKPLLSRNEAFSRLFLRLSQRLTSVDQDKFDEFIKQLEKRNDPKLNGFERVLFRKPQLSSFERVILGFVSRLRWHPTDDLKIASETDEKNGYAHTLHGYFVSACESGHEESKFYDKAIASDTAGMAHTLKGVLCHDGYPHAAEYRRPDLIQAEACFKAAAERKDALGFHFYGKLLYSKNKTNAQKYLGAPYLAKAIACGHIGSLYEYAVSFVHPMNPAEAINWFKLGARYGCLQCTYCAAVCFEIGDGARQDAAQAALYYRAADACENLPSYHAAYTISTKSDKIRPPTNRLEKLKDQEPLNFGAIYHYVVAARISLIHLIDPASRKRRMEWYGLDKNSEIPLERELKSILEHAPDVFERLWLDDYKNPLQGELKKQAIDTVLGLRPEVLPIATNQLLASLLTDCPEPELKNKAAEFRAAVNAAVVVVKPVIPPPGALAAHSAIQTPKKKTGSTAAAAAAPAKKR